MNLSDLQRKDIVNINTGERLGRIIDAIMNESGLIEYFIVMKRRLFFFKSNEEKNVYIKNIKKIGMDVILVEELWSIQK